MRKRSLPWRVIRITRLVVSAFAVARKGRRPTHERFAGVLVDVRLDVGHVQVDEGPATFQGDGGLLRHCVLLC